MMKDKFELKVIGKIVSPIIDTAKMPLQGVEAQAHIEAKFTDTLDGIDKHSHVFVLCWMDQARRDRLKVIPRRHGGENQAKGVFALRSPARPNPISLNTTRLLKREENILYLENIDMVDGTPIIDIKPYSTGWDCIFSAHNNSTYNTYSKMPAADVLADMLRQAGN
ncbi:MAG TPA: tRNA (N6-threonylcarbamoyladenosine(37)-N6)-methyltransferase TrmO, partial [Actinobacteria bacterium]|nr:tRNA (N6-threonylcarbamoyladenosine(37)-N6)-methyltransferase TrmO [Actinomycetes bacterium]HEX21428.1 tRNA (N6-threonylcarbamoyladenosine(37)-N6)-methyltransferase TrmO [Actinomycetota bacterium]